LATRQSAAACATTSPPLASNPEFGFFRHMEKNTTKGQIDPRKERLAKALRENLRRRKAQARERVVKSGSEGEPGKMSDRQA
jgi:hypothetical protein